MAMLTALCSGCMRVIFQRKRDDRLEVSHSGLTMTLFSTYTWAKLHIRPIKTGGVCLTGSEPI
jgi:hypothetical protein